MSPTSGAPKRAVVVIHGMGNQAPMTTLRSFVEAVWTSQPVLAKDGRPMTWTKRDELSGNLELWRITTSEDVAGRRTDFYELYWADMMEATRLSSVVDWLKRLFVRPLRRVPENVRAPWWVGWIGIAALSAFMIGLVLLALATIRALPASLPLAAAGVLLGLAGLLFLWWLRHRVLVEVVGDAARYLTASPENIAARSRIRQAGLDLLKALHDDGSYERIVLACHSLGTVIGYDLLALYWGTVCKQMVHSGPSPELADLEHAAAGLREKPTEDSLAAFRKAQWAYFNEVRRLSAGRWLVSDFVTMGSPLAHAHFLLVDDGVKLMPSDDQAIEDANLSGWHGGLGRIARVVARHFSARAARREFPLCPPIPDRGEAITYRPKPAGGDRVPHHAAVFAAVRWTNVYAPRKRVLRGDVIGGPVAPLFGPGVADVPLEGAVGSAWIAHTRYWSLGQRDDKHLDVLRDAVRLLDH